MTREEFAKSNIGDEVIIFDKILNKNIKGTIIRKNSRDVLCIVDDGWDIDQDKIDEFNLPTKYLNLKGWWAPFERVKLLSKSKPNNEIINKNSSIKKNSWANFAYGRQVDIENLSRPPLNARPFEFL